MDSNLITPPDIVSNGLHSVLVVDPIQDEVDAIIKFCQYSKVAFNVYIYTPNMDNNEWLENAAQASDAVIVNSRTESYKHLCLRQNSYYYGPKIYIENQNKLDDLIHYFAAQVELDK